MAKFKKGEGGRPPGALNKTTRVFKEAVLEVYNELGREEGLNGTEKFRLWARKNEAQFYQIASRLIPHEVVGPGEHGEHMVKTINHIHEVVKE